MMAQVATFTPGPSAPVALASTDDAALREDDPMPAVALGTAGASAAVPAEAALGRAPREAMLTSVDPPAPGTIASRPMARVCNFRFDPFHHGRTIVVEGPNATAAHNRDVNYGAVYARPAVPADVPAQTYIEFRVEIFAGWYDFALFAAPAGKVQGLPRELDTPWWREDVGATFHIHAEHPTGASGREPMEAIILRHDVRLGILLDTIRRTVSLVKDGWVARTVDLPAVTVGQQYFFGVRPRSDAAERAVVVHIVPPAEWRFLLAPEELE